MYNKTDFKIAGAGHRWYIALKDAEESTYLLKDGKVSLWYSDICKVYPNGPEREKLVYFISKKEAEQFLDNYLRGQNMSNYDDRLAQCDKDIAALQAEKAKIVKEKEAAEVKKFYLGTEFTDKYGVRYLLVRLIGNHEGIYDRVGLVHTNGLSKGYYWRHTALLKVDTDSSGYYVTRLPTTSPEGFGLDKKYGVFE